MKMSLSSILENYSHIELALKSDNLEILDFFQKIRMDTTTMSIRYDRTPNYFTYLDQQGHKNFVVIFRNKDWSIGGLASIVLRKLTQNGRSITCGYLSDLRLSNTLYMRTRVQWRSAYAELIENYNCIEEFDDCKYMYSAILNENRDALRAFTGNKSQILYKEMFEYSTTNVLMRLPFSLSSLLPNFKKKSVSLRFATQDDQEKLVNFLNLVNKSKTFGFNQGELIRRLETWDGFSIQSFILVLNEEGKIIGCVAPWTNCKAKRLVISNMNFFYKVLAKIFKPKRSRFSSGDQELKVMYLTHLEFLPDTLAKMQKELLNQMLDFIFKQKLSEDIDLVSFINLPDQSLTKDLKYRYKVHTTTKGTLYQVLSRTKLAQNKFIVPTENQNNLSFTFELGIA